MISRLSLGREKFLQKANSREGSQRQVQRGQSGACRYREGSQRHAGTERGRVQRKHSHQQSLLKLGFAQNTADVCDTFLIYPGLEHGRGKLQTQPFLH